MDSLFDPAARERLLDRVAALRPDARRLWGRMDPAQAVTHCAIALEAATGDAPLKQGLIGKILSPFVRASSLGPKPFPRNSPTHPTFVVADARDLARERERLVAGIRKFADAGPAAAARWEHGFFGRLTGEEWGVLMHKHIDHHLAQFGA